MSVLGWLIIHGLVAISRSICLPQIMNFFLIADIVTAII